MCEGWHKQLKLLLTGNRLSSVQCMYTWGWAAPNLSLCVILKALIMNGLLNCTFPSNQSGTLILLSIVFKKQKLGFSIRWTFFKLSLVVIKNWLFNSIVWNLSQEHQTSHVYLSLWDIPIHQCPCFTQREKKGCKLMSLVMDQYCVF